MTKIECMAPEKPSPFSKREQELVDRALARPEEYPPLSPDQAKVLGRVYAKATLTAPNQTGAT
jgi:hypothetical protein